MRVIIYSINPDDGFVRHTWRAGALIHKAIGFDAAYAVEHMGDLITVLENIAKHPVDEIQFWGHGNAGRFYIGNEFVCLDKKGEFHCVSYEPATEEFTYLDKLSVRFRRTLPRILNKGLLWLRTCGSFSTEKGQAFAIALATATKSTVAAHTHMIGLVHSGLHILSPNEVPDWRTDEGNWLNPNTELAELKESSLKIPKSFLFYKMTIPPEHIKS